MHFIDEKVRLNSQHYVSTLLPELFDDCHALLPNGFIFQQNGAPADASRHAQERISERNPDYIKKNEWPPNSPDHNPLDYHIWGTMLHLYQKHQPQPKNKTELQEVLYAIFR